MRRGLTCLLIVCFGYALADGADAKFSRRPSPKVNQETWVMLEFWPEVFTITVAAYFLDSSYKSNQELCQLTKEVFDRDQEARSKTLKKQFSSYRLCLSLSDAVQRGYIEDTR